MLLRFISFSLLLFGYCTSVFAGAGARVVVADGSLTEIVYALGAEQDLVAVDSTSVYPSEATKLPNVGYLRALSSEGILSVQPDIFLTTQSAGPKKTLDDIQAAGVKLKQINSAYSLAGVLDKIDQVALTFNKTSAAAPIKKRFEKQMNEQVQALKAAFTQSPRVLMFLNMQGNQLMAAGQDTQAQALLDMLGWSNAAEGFRSYKPMSSEAMLAADADLIVVLQHGPTSAELNKMLLMSRAAEQGRLLAIDSSALLGFGIRLPSALAEIRQKLSAAQP
ncbi:heme/hemin ABC transporter substrate-binding protein [Agaribacterium haliotis]|uniref:heme/hemin ABC transporter substrate-binding protein n=1 Tax=Agaribacterium haliotis TaxID=2013869 RepID=UPI000BB54B0C|nr:ABC transporter substrate-binding protein [Agaribacterium haliotis]